MFDLKWSAITKLYFVLNFSVFGEICLITVKSLVLDSYDVLTHTRPAVRNIYPPNPFERQIERIFRACSAYDNISGAHCQARSQKD